MKYKRYVLIIAIALILFLVGKSYLTIQPEINVIVIDPGHGGSKEKLYTYYGDEFKGNISSLIKVQSGNKEYYTEREEQTPIEKRKLMHTGDPGATYSKDNVTYFEKDINLGIANMLSEILIEKYSVNSTRKDDRYIFLERRREISNKSRADLFISIHQNSVAAECENLNNAEVYYNNIDLKDISELILNKLTANLDLNTGKIIENKNFAVLNTSINSMLIEVNFMCNEKNAKMLSNEENQRKIAKTIADSLISYYN